MAASFPLSGFHFSVYFELFPQFSIDTKFQSVSGLSASVEMDSISEGGQNQFQHSFPKKPSYDPLVLKRGMVKDLSGLKIWVDNSLHSFVYSPANLIITLLNHDHEPTKAYLVTRAVPQSFSLTNFDAESNDYVVESFTLSYQFFKELPIP